ncbi:MAG: hypothetical protein ACREQ5_02895 [Candidatus Dormibacteria bacterium]
MGVPLMGRVLFDKVYLPPWVTKNRLLPTEDRFLSPIRATLDQAEMIEASEVCELFYTGTAEEDWNFERDFPSFAMPFPVFWIEMKKPSRIFSRLTGTHSTERLVDRTGFLFQRLPLQWGKKALEQMRLPGPMEIEGKLACHFGPCAPSIFEKQRKYGATAWQHFTEEERLFSTLVRYYRQNEKIKELLEHPPESGYSCGIHLFLQSREAAFGPMGTWILLIGPGGRPLFRSEINPGFITESVVPDPEMLMGLDCMLSPVLFAVQRTLHEMAAGMAEASMSKN